ncbi:Two-component response regulator, FixJ family, consists of REC and HTH domains [Sphingobium sp. AP50]|uniref:LuxR C-terminal-related transcriptional regulator n=1 Tax=Sphingobium sp. AP50 TaxID=1884369 RepID=UPI0008D54C2D|nr:LuxR C-terminal-related transcriptional regulator [Sphingobium sp. AP50]SEI84430.1 Two-component response regulator, FixJ family, consists of REC and HTH domains [Sphingobium sp. AP50]
MRAEDNYAGGMHGDAVTSILENMPIGVAIFAGDGRLSHANGRFNRTTGGSVRSVDCLLDTCSEGYYPDGAPLEKPHHPALRAFGGEQGMPAIDFLLRNGEVGASWVRVRAMPYADPDLADISGAIVLLEEIEEPSHSQRASQSMDASFRRFADHSSLALWIACTNTGALKYRSPAAEILWDVDLADVPGLDLHGHIHPEDRTHVSDMRALAHAGQVQRLSYRIIDREGIVRCQVRETCFAIPPGPGEESWIGGIIEDVSPEIQLYLVQRSDLSDPVMEAELCRRAHRIKRFSTAHELMQVAEVLNPGCLIVDLRGNDNPETSFSRILDGRPADLQVIFIGDGTTPTQHVIGAMRGGAVDFLITPLCADELDRALRHASEALPCRFDAPSGERGDLADRLARLPRREREVLLGLVDGGTNKSIARALGISPRTVEAHRAHLMERLNVSTLSALLQIAHRAGVTADRPWK